MRINVRLTEPFQMAVGQRKLSLELTEDTRVGDLMALLRKRYPGLSEDFDEMPPLIFVDDEEAGAETALEDGSQVYFIWAVAGG